MLVMLWGDGGQEGMGFKNEKLIINYIIIIK
jgi:hypothetical protein